MKTILCVYATRQIDSNLFMSSTIFNGLSKCGFDVDMLFCGYDDVCQVFLRRYGHYFRHVDLLRMHGRRCPSFLSAIPHATLLYNFFQANCADWLHRPYRLSDVGNLPSRKYDLVLSFVPTSIGGKLAIDVKKALGARLVQFWTDPLSIGGCDDVSDMPRRRWLQRKIEHCLLKGADKIVFNFPLLCEMEKLLHPEFSGKMTWSDVGFVEHIHDEYVPRNSTVTIGLFGAYQRKVRNIEPFLAAVREMGDVHFVLRGDSDVAIDKSAYPNLDVSFGRVSIDEVEELEKECDILVSLSAHKGLTPPGKTFYYASYHKPIVFIGDGRNYEYTKDYLMGLGRYLVCKNEPADIERCMRSAIAQLKDFKWAIPERMQLDTIARKIVD